MKSTNKLQLTGTNAERLAQIMAEADKVTASINSLSKSNLDKTTKATLVAEQQEYLATLRTQFTTIKAIINKHKAEAAAKAAKEAKEAEKAEALAEARQLNLYKICTAIPSGMFEELPDNHKAIVSLVTTKSNSTFYAIDLSKLTGIITVNDVDYTPAELYAFVTSHNPMFSYSNWCYLTPEIKKHIYYAFKALVDATGLPVDVETYRSLHTAYDTIPQD